MNQSIGVGNELEKVNQDLQKLSTRSLYNKNFYLTKSDFYWLKHAYLNEMPNKDCPKATKQFLDKVEKHLKGLNYDS